MKTHTIKIALLTNLLLSVLIVEVAEAGLYLDGGVSYRRTDNVAGTGESDNISSTDILVGFSDKINLPLGLGHVQDSYNVRGKYRDARYSRFSQYDYTEWAVAGDFRKYMNKRWWLLFSGEYLLVDADSNNVLTCLDRLSLGVENGYRFTHNLLLTAGYLYRNTSFDNNDDINVSHGYSMGAQYDFGDFIAAFVKYRVDDDYIDGLGFFAPDTRIKTSQAGILLAVNEHSALRLMYEFIDDGNITNNVFSTDFVLRY